MLITSVGPPGGCRDESKHRTLNPVGTYFSEIRWMLHEPNEAGAGCLRRCKVREIRTLMTGAWCRDQRTVKNRLQQLNRMRSELPTISKECKSNPISSVWSLLSYLVFHCIYISITVIMCIISVSASCLRVQHVTWFSVWLEDEMSTNVRA